MRHVATRTPRRPAGPAVLLLGLLVAATALGAVVLVVAGDRPPEPRYASSATVSEPAAPIGPGLEGDDPLVGDATPAALGLLREWDTRRAEAWAAGDVEALAGLYVRGSAAGRRDVAMLRQYADRGLRVEQLTTQVLSAEVTREGPRSKVMAVTDRVLSGSVTDGHAAAPLPADAATRHLLTWRRVDGVWLLATVEPQA